jgi:VCBS repeat-containing protein
MGIVTGTGLTFDGQTPSSPVPVTSTQALPSGGFVVTWVDHDGDIQLQTFDNDGVLQDSADIALDTGTYAGYFAPTLAVLSSGDIAITWTALDIGGETDVLLQFLDSDLDLPGTPPLIVNTYTTGSQALPQLTFLNTTGGLAITWFGDSAVDDIDVSLQVIPPGPPSSDIAVNTTTSGDQDFSIITDLATGFVVSWFDEDSEEVYVRVFDDDGTAGTEVAASTLPFGSVGILGTSALASGGFVTAWSGETAGDSEGIALRIFDDTGTALTAVIEANSSTSGIQMLSGITALTGGGLVVTWGSCGCSGSGSGLAVFNDDGTVRRSEVVLDAGSDTIPAVKALADGSFVAAWVTGDIIDNDLGFAIRVFNADGTLRYSEDVDLDDSVDILSGAPVEIAALDNGGFVLTAPLYTGTYSHVFDTTRDGPTSSSTTATLLESSSYAFSLSDFPFSDAEQDLLIGVKITAPPANGTLTLNGTAVTAGQTILPADIASGNLVWTPVAGANGNALASLSYKLQDDGGTAGGDSDTSDAYTLTFNVTRINDAPTAANVTRTAMEDTPFVFSADSFAFTDGDGDDLKNVTIISPPATGTLTLDGVAVTAGQNIAAADIAEGKLVWTPPEETSGTNIASLTFKVQDTGGIANGGFDTSGPYTLKFNVSAVNDAPVLDYQGPTTTKEDAALKLNVLADASDIDGGTLKVTDAEIVSGFGKITINKNGALTYDPTKAPNQDIAEGESRTVTLKYTVSDGNGGESSKEIDITVEGISPDIFKGTKDRDTLTGTSSADRIFGLAGRDRLDGQGGDDILKGGRSADVFVFGADYGRDLIVDFRPAKGDRIDLSDAMGITGFSDLVNNHATEASNRLNITADDGSVLVLKGIGLDNLEQGNFLF